MAAQVMEVCSLHSSSRRDSAATPKASDAVGPTGHQRRQRCGCDPKAWCGHCETGRRGLCGWGYSGTPACAAPSTMTERAQIAHLCEIPRICWKFVCAVCVFRLLLIFTAAAACTSSLKCISAHHINIMFHSSALHLFPLYCTRATVCLFGIVSTLCQRLSGLRVVIVCDCRSQLGCSSWGQSSCESLLLCAAIRLCSVRNSDRMVLLLIRGPDVLPYRIFPQPINMWALHSVLPYVFLSSSIVCFTIVPSRIGPGLPFVCLMPHSLAVDSASTHSIPVCTFRGDRNIFFACTHSPIPGCASTAPSYVQATRNCVHLSTCLDSTQLHFLPR